MDLSDVLLNNLDTILYMFQAAVFTGQSMYKGPIVGALKALCFSPNTPVKLNNGKVVSMKNLKIGDVLENNSHVIGTLRLKGSKHNCYYEIWSEDLGEFIYVTGQHKMFPRKVDPSIEKHILDFYNNSIPVSEYKHAKLTNKYDAVALVKIVSEVIEGKGGGGRKDFAQAGGANKDKINEAFKTLSKKIN